METNLILLAACVLLEFVIIIFLAWQKSEVDTKFEDTASDVDDTFEEIMDLMGDIKDWAKGFGHTIEARLTKGAKEQVEQTLETIASKAIGGWIQKNLGGMFGGVTEAFQAKEEPKE